MDDSDTAKNTDTADACLKVFEVSKKTNSDLYDRLIKAEAELKERGYELGALKSAVSKNCSECSKDECSVGATCWFWKWSPFNDGKPKPRRKYVKK